MVITDTVTGMPIEAVIELLRKKDYQVISQDNNRFDKFNWDEYRNREVYKLRLKSSALILGLICITDHKDEATNAIEIELLEVSAENIGRGKKYENIGACLIAFACRESFKRGHDGCVFLIPKSTLINHYKTKYGFYHLPIISTQRPEGIMVLYDQEARKLIRKYFD